MTFNPYAPPDDVSQQAMDGGDPGAAGAPQEWGIEEVIKLAWDIVKKDPVTLIIAPLIVVGAGQIIGMIPGQIVSRMQISPLSWEAIGMSMAGGLVGTAVQSFFQTGLLRLQLTAVRGGSASIAQVFSGGSAYFRMLAVNFLIMLAVMAGSLLLIVPGIILAMGFSMAQFYVADADMGPIDALNASWNAMRGHKLPFFGYLLVSVAVVLVGLAACCVGVIVSMAVVYIATAIIFTRVSGRMALQAPPSPYGPPGGYSGQGGGGAGPMPPPGGGWGAA